MAVGATVVVLSLVAPTTVASSARPAVTVSSTRSDSVPAPPTRDLAYGTTATRLAATPDGQGYWIADAAGGVSTFGDAGSYGSAASLPLNGPVISMAPTATGAGYWLLGSDGGIFSFGDAQFYGSMGGKPLNKPIVGMAAVPGGGGYWEVAADGGIFSFGDAQFYGSMGGKPLNQPIVGMAATPNGGGYWEVASDGGIFSFGNAQFYGSMGGHPLNRPVVGMAATRDGLGYWEVASDGGVFCFGDAAFHGSLVGSAPTAAGIVPPANPAANLPPNPNFLDACYQNGTSTSCLDEEVQATDAARAAEGLGPLQLPLDFSTLTPAEQLFVVTDAERVDRGLPPFVGLDGTLDSEAAAAAAVNADPSPTQPPAGMTVTAWGGNWAENANALGASYYWLYDDGLGSSNLECTVANLSGCWGHRDNELGLSGYQASYGGTLVMGAAEDTGPNHGGWASLTELTVLASGPLPPLVYTWAQAVADGAG